MSVKKPSMPKDPKSGITDPLEYLRRVVADDTEAPAVRVRAAVTLAQYEHTKRADGGKKEELAEAADKASKGKFGPSDPPKLVVNNR